MLEEIQTERLVFREFTRDDASLIYQLNLDPEVTRFTHDPVRDLEHAQEILEKSILPQYNRNNYGRWALYLKPGLEFIGWCGLKYRPETDEVDLGFRLKKDYWGQGLATEAAKASIRYGFETLKLPRLVGRAEPENIASWKVLEKCGLQYIGTGQVDGYRVLVFEIRNPETV